MTSALSCYLSLYAKLFPNLEAQSNNHLTLFCGSVGQELWQGSAGWLLPHDQLGSPAGFQSLCHLIWGIQDGFTHAPGEDGCRAGSARLSSLSRGSQGLSTSSWRLRLGLELAEHHFIVQSSCRPISREETAPTSQWEKCQRICGHSLSTTV